MNWNDPNWVGATGQWAGAIFSAAAVVVAVGIAIWSIRQAQKQFQQARYDDARPVLIISSPPDGIRVQSDQPAWIAQGGTMTATIKNTGTGVAFEMMSIIYPSESVRNDPNPPIDQTAVGDPEHWTFTKSCLEVNEGDDYEHQRYGLFFDETKRKIGKYSFFA